MIRTTLRGGVLKRVLGTAILALASVSAAQAAVITFDRQAGPAYNGSSFQEAGYTVSFEATGNPPPGTVQVGRFIDGSNPADCGPNLCPTNNPTTYLDLFNSGLVSIMSAPAGMSFRFSGLDGSFIGAPGMQDIPDFPAAIQVFGFQGDNIVAEIQFNLTDVIAFQHFDAADADPDRSTIDGATFALTDFTQIAIVGFRCDASGNCTGLDNGPGQVGLDNIVLSDLPPVNPVPEPATLSLLAFGLLGLGSRMRRRH